MRLSPPPESRGGAGPVLEGLHPRHRAGLPQADDRAARRFIAPTFAGAARRRALRRRAAARDLRRARARRDRRGQRRRASRPSPRSRPAVGADRLLQPARVQGSRAAAGLLRAAARRPRGWADVLGASTARRIGELHAEFSEFCVRARRAAAARLRVHPRVAVAEPLPLPAELDYPRARPLGADLAQPADHACARPTSRGEPPHGDGRRSSTSASARSARPTSS